MPHRVFRLFNVLLFFQEEAFLLTHACISCFRNLLIENFIPPEEKNKIMSRLHFDSEEDQWRLQPVLPERSVDDFHVAESLCCKRSRGDRKILQEGTVTH